MCQPVFLTSQPLLLRKECTMLELFIAILTLAAALIRFAGM